MTFTYSPSSPDDTTRVRFHIGDTTETTAILTDEDIAFAISEAGGWRNAVIWCLDYIIQQLALEDGQRLDWLEMDRADAMKYYERLKASKRSTLGITGAVSGGITGSVGYVVRHDSPDYYDDDDLPAGIN